jgi:hypothetical protein
LMNCHCDYAPFLVKQLVTLKPNTEILIENLLTG